MLHVTEMQCSLFWTNSEAKLSWDVWAIANLHLFKRRICYFPGWFKESCIPVSFFCFIWRCRESRRSNNFGKYPGERSYSEGQSVYMHQFESRLACQHLAKWHVSFNRIFKIVIDHLLNSAIKITLGIWRPSRMFTQTEAVPGSLLK